MTAIASYSAIICEHCGDGLVACPRCNDRGEYAMLCINRDCAAVPQRRRRAELKQSRQTRLEAKKRAAHECYKCPLGSTEIIGTDGLCCKHRLAVRARWAKVKRK